MDDQWLVSLAHTDADMAKWVDAFGELAKELRAPDQGGSRHHGCGFH